MYDYIKTNEIKVGNFEPVKGKKPLYFVVDPNCLEKSFFVIGLAADHIEKNGRLALAELFGGALWCLVPF